MACVHVFLLSVVFPFLLLHGSSNVEDFGHTYDGSVLGFWKCRLPQIYVIYNSDRSKIFLDSVQQDPHFGEIRILNAGTDNAVPGDHATTQPLVFVLIVMEKSFLLRLFVCHHRSETTVFNRCFITRKRWFKCHVPYYSNSDATFNFMELCITLSGDVHPLPGPERDAAKIPVCIGNSRVRNKNKVSRGHVKFNCITIQWRMPNSLKHRNNNKQLEIAHLNAESLKCGHHFHEIKEMALQKSFDILTFSETWFNSTTTNASVEIDGYSIYRLDRLRKIGAGVCAYVKHGQR